MLKNTIMGIGKPAQVSKQTQRINVEFLVGHMSPVSSNNPENSLFRSFQVQRLVNSSNSDFVFRSGEFSAFGRPRSHQVLRKLPQQTFLTVLRTRIRRLRDSKWAICKEICKQNASAPHLHQPSEVTSLDVPPSARNLGKTRTNEEFEHNDSCSTQTPFRTEAATNLCQPALV